MAVHPMADFRFAVRSGFRSAVRTIVNGPNIDSPLSFGMPAIGSWVGSYSKLAQTDHFQMRVENAAANVMAHLPEESPFRMFTDLNYWRDYAIQFARGDAKVAKAMTALVREYPNINSHRDLTRVRKEVFTPEVFARLPWVMRIGLRSNFLFHIAVSEIAKRFSAGRNITEAVATTKALRAQGFDTTLDFPGEATEYEWQVQQHMRQYVGAMKGAFDLKLEGMNLSTKLTGLGTHLLTDEGSRVMLKMKFRDILREAKKYGVERLTIDMEEFKYKDMTLEFFKSILAEPEFRSGIRLEIVIQAYLKCAQDDLKAMDEWVEQRFKETGERTDVRLVKGAYVKFEKEEAISLGYANPICEDEAVLADDPNKDAADKAATDRNYEACVRFLLERRDRFRIAFATHNLRTICSVLAMADEMEIPYNELEFQMLLGMPSEKIGYALKAMGCNVTFYALIGETGEKVRYLARRMDENTDMNSCFNDLDRYLEGKISLWRLVLPPGYKQVDAIG